MADTDIEKLQRMANDTITHKVYVMLVCQRVFQYLCSNNQVKLAIDLLKRASSHDNSKFNNSEFKNMASILKSDECFTNANYELSEEERKAIEAHWRSNRHHPEYFDDISEMTDLDMWEMVCDWYARSLQFKTEFMEFVSERQRNRFKFGEEQYNKIVDYCRIVESLNPKV